MGKHVYKNGVTCPDCGKTFRDRVEYVLHLLVCPGKKEVKK